MKKLSKIILSVVAALFVITACANGEDEASDTGNAISDPEKTQVVTSIYPVYEIVKEVAGEQAEVSLMVGENEDAHHYEPSAQAVAAVNEADLFIYSSDQMEFWAESLLDVVENENLETIELAEDLDLDLETTDSEQEETHAHDSEHDHDHGGIDPHFWLNPVAVDEVLPSITNVLSEDDPENAEIYAENAESFSATLHELDNAYQEAFVDAEDRAFVVQHQAFGHLAEQYNLEQVAVGGLMTEVEADPQALANIVTFVRENDVSVIYYQNGDSSSTAEAIANETDAEISVLYDLENKPADGHFEDGSYVEVMEYNLEQLQKSIE